MSRTSATWSAYHVKRLADGGRTSHCTLKTDDGKDCVYSYTQKKRDTGVVQEIFAEDDSTSPNSSINSGNSNASLIDPDELDQRQAVNVKSSNAGDIREVIKKEMTFVQHHVDPNIKPLEFYEKNEHHLPHLSKAAKHFFLASSSSVESESFFSDATSSYGDKQRNRLSADSARNSSNAKKKYW